MLVNQSVSERVNQSVSLQDVEFASQLTTRVFNIEQNLQDAKTIDQKLDMTANPMTINPKTKNTGPKHKPIISLVIRHQVIDGCSRQMLNYTKKQPNSISHFGCLP